MFSEVDIKIIGRGNVKAPEIVNKEDDNAVDRECGSDSTNTGNC
jgi:hypothetical protein